MLLVFLQKHQVIIDKMVTVSASRVWTSDRLLAVIKEEKWYFSAWKVTCYIQ